jgi:ElaB/YqjD/DUF883 family membrane-anchored ribosome-binding protein
MAPIFKQDPDDVDSFLSGLGDLSPVQSTPLEIPSVQSKPIFSPAGDVDSFLSGLGATPPQYDLTPWSALISGVWKPSIFTGRVVGGLLSFAGGAISDPTDIKLLDYYKEQRQSVDWALKYKKSLETGEDMQIRPRAERQAEIARLRELQEAIPDEGFNWKQGFFGGDLERRSYQKRINRLEQELQKLPNDIEKALDGELSNAKEFREKAISREGSWGKKFNDMVNLYVVEPTTAFLKDTEGYTESKVAQGAEQAAVIGLPLIAGSALAGPKGVAAMTYYITENQHGHIVKEMEEEGLLLDGTESHAYKEAVKLAWLTGGAELVSNVAFFQLAKGAGALLGKAGLKPAVTSAVTSRTVAQRTAYLAGKVALAFPAQLAEEMPTEAVQNFLEVGVRNEFGLEGGRELSLSESFNEMLPWKEQGQILAWSVFFMSAMNAPMEYGNIQLEEKTNFIRLLAEDDQIRAIKNKGKMVTAEDVKLARLRAKIEITPEFVKNKEKEYFTALFQLEEGVLDTMKDNGFNVGDFFRMQKTDPELFVQVKQEFMDQGTSPKYEAWKNGMERKEARRAFETQEIDEVINKVVGMPDWFKADMQRKGYVGKDYTFTTDTGQELTLDNTNQIALQWSAFVAYADQHKKKGQTYQEYYDAIQSINRNIGEFADSSPEGLMKIIAEKAAGMRPDETPEHMRILPQMRQAKTLKDALVAFRSLMESYAPEQVAFVDELLGYPEYTSQALSKKFTLQLNARVKKEKVDGYVKVNQDGTTKAVIVDPMTFADEALEFARVLHHEVIHTIVSSTFSGDQNKLTQSQKDLKETSDLVHEYVMKDLEGNFTAEEIADLKKRELENPEEFLAYFLTEGNFRQRILSVIPDGMIDQIGYQMSDFAQDSVARLNVKDVEQKYLLGQIFNVLDEGGVLFQAEGVHGSGALFNKPSKQFRLSGEGTMYEGAGFYFVMMNALKGQKGNEVQRAKWYANSYKKPTEKYKEIFHKLQFLVENLNLHEQLGEEMPDNFSEQLAGEIFYNATNANEKGDLKPGTIVIENMNLNEDLVDPVAMEALYDYVENEVFPLTEKDLFTRAIYRVRFAKGMNRVGTTDTKIQGKKYILENWLKSDLIETLQKKIRELAFSHDPYDSVEEAQADQDKMQAILDEEEVREHLVEEGLRQLEAILEGEEMPTEGLPFGIPSTYDQESFFAEEIDKMVEKFLKNNRQDPTVDDSLLRDEEETGWLDMDTGKIDNWIFKDKKDYYMLPWNERVPQNILEALRKRLGKSEDGLFLLTEASWTGEQLYRGIQRKYFNGSDHAVSEFLDSIGIIGTIYEGEGGQNAVAYNEDRLEITHPPTLFQKGADRAVKGKVLFDAMGRFRLKFMSTADFGTLVHEWGHIFLQNLPTGTQNRVAKEFGLKKFPELGSADYTRVHEGFANSYMRYLGTGVSPSLSLRETFATSSDLLLSMYDTLDPQKVDGKLRKIFDNMLSDKRERLRLRIAGLQGDDDNSQIEQREIEYLKAVNAYNAAYKLPTDIQNALDSGMSFAQYLEETREHLQSKMDPVFWEENQQILDGATQKNLPEKMRKLTTAHLVFRQKGEIKAIEKTIARYKNPKVKKTLSPEAKVVMSWITDGVSLRKKKKAETKEFERAMEGYQAEGITLAELRSGPGDYRDYGPDTLKSINEQMTAILNHSQTRTSQAMRKNWETFHDVMNANREELKGKKSRMASGIFAHKKGAIRQMLKTGILQQLKEETILNSIFDSHAGDAFYESVFGEVNRGVDRQLQYMEGAEKILAKLEGMNLDMRSSKQYARGKSPLEKLIAWSQGAQPEPVTIKLSREQVLPEMQNLTMTRGELISLFLTTLNPKSRKNILEGGYIVDDLQTSEVPFKITEQELESLFGNLSENDLFIATVLREYYAYEHKNLAESYYDYNKLYLPEEEYYFPQTTSRGSRGETKAFKDQLYTNSFMNYFQKGVENLSKTKDRMDHKRPLVIEDAFKITTRSLHDSSKYVGLGKALRLLRAVLFDSYSETKDEDGNSVQELGTQNFIEVNFGKEIHNHLLDYYESLAGQKAPPDEITSMLEGIRRRNVLAILAANPKVAAKQIASGSAYYTEASPDVIMKAVAKGPWSKEEMEAISIQMKERFKVGPSRDMLENFNEAEIRRLFSNSDLSTGDLGTLLAGIRKMDQLAVGLAFRIAEMEGKTGKELKERSEYLVRKTQPNYHVKDRSKLQRSHNPLAKLFTSFGSVRAAYFNMGFETILRIRDAKSMKERMDILRGYATFSFFNSLAIGSINLGWAVLMDTEDEEDEFEEAWKGYMTELFNSTIGTTYGLGEFFDYMTSPQYGQGNNLYTGPALRVLEGIKQTEDVEDLWEVTKATLTLFGLPAQNIENLVKAPITVGNKINE